MHHAKLARYLLIDVLGRGGAGVVFLAYDPELDRKVAVKLVTIQADLHAEEAQRRLLREAQALAKLSHPNVIAAFDVGRYDVDDAEMLRQHGGVLEEELGNRGVFIVMEYVAGESLAQWLKKDHRSWIEVLEIFAQAGRGLQAAHECGLVHRDFKPSNVLIGGDGRVRVLDFGLARQFDDLPAERYDDRTIADFTPVPEEQETRVVRAVEKSHDTHRLLQSAITECGTIVGTPTYMSPEHHVGAGVTHRSDQYSFCVALFIALYGRAPFVAETLGALQRAKNRGATQPPPLHTKVPSWVHKAVLKGLSPTDEGRFVDMAALLAALARGRTRTQRRLAAVGLTAVISVAAVPFLTAGEADACNRAAELGSVWSEPSQKRIHDAWSAVDVPFAEDVWRTVEDRATAYAEAWKAARQEACEATHSRHEQSDTLYDRMMICLDGHRAEFESLITTFAEPDRRLIERAVHAVEDLPAPDLCSAQRMVSAHAPPDPSELAQVAEVEASLRSARTQRRIGDYQEARHAAMAAIEAASGLAHRATLGSALWYAADIERALSNYDASRDLAARAHEVAVELGDDHLALEATTTLAAVIGYELSQVDEGMRWGSIAQAYERRQGRETMGLHNELGLMLARAGRYMESIEHFERATEAAEAQGADLQTAVYQANMVIPLYYGLEDYAKAELVARRSLTIRLQLLGPMHPLLGQSWNNLGMALEGTDQLDEARRAYESAYAIWQRSLPADHINLAHALNNIGNIAREEGNLDGAFEHYQRALAIYEARKSARIDRARTVLNLARVEHARERYDKALEFARTAVSLYEGAIGKDHDQVTHALIVLTEIYFSQKQYAPAIEPLERVLTIRRRDGATTSPEAIGDATFFLSQALEHTRQDPARARRLAREAVTAYAQAAGRDPKLKTWLDDAEQWAEKLDRGGTPARTATLESP